MIYYAEDDMPQNEKLKVPNDILAEEISKALLEASLIPENREADLESKLKSGGLNQEDWHLWIDEATNSQDAKEKGDGQTNQ